MTTSSETPRIPAGFIKGLVPTLNSTGFMSEHPDIFSLAFIDFAGACDGEVLDMGCAYGVATLAALEKGARVTACDMDERHVTIVAERTAPRHKAQLRTVVGALPGVDFPEDSFAAVLASRVLHFLKGPDAELSVAKMHRWLQPGGRAFLITDTPYGGFWKAHAPVYEQKKSAGDPWPGFMPDASVYLPAGQRKPGFLNPMDPDILARVCRAAGFEILRQGFTGRRAEADATPAPDAREHAGVIALKT